ncbi:hypothetical protein GCM10022246_17630 [Pedobacter ginsengiterrae]|uniref:Major facilitator superfamily (MFS) profile domain-containing protein n=1 Tax=Pedobacter ginsengiterrae TaxID=871696 RepID=A0ABP7PH02_9SPHI
MLELLIGRETLITPERFQIGAVVKSYRTMLGTMDFCSGLTILGLGYAALIIFGMASPFLIEKVLHYSSQVTGNLALVSGVAVLIGGVISKSLLHKPFLQKLILAAALMIAATIAVGLYTLHSESLYTLLAFVVLVHTAAAFIFNNIFSYCLLRFPAYSGKAAGLTGGGFYIVASFAGTLLINILEIRTQFFLGIGYLILALASIFLLLYTKWRKDY